MHGGQPGIGADDTMFDAGRSGTDSWATIFVEVDRPNPPKNRQVARGFSLSATSCSNSTFEVGVVEVHPRMRCDPRRHLRMPGASTAP